MRRCGRCGETKPIEEFNWRRQAKAQRDNLCRPCRAEYHHEHYLANKAKYIESARRRRSAIGTERMVWILEYLKTHPCVDCGETDREVLEFDHLGDKEFSIARGSHDRSWAAVLAEIAKCEVVCANCHRRRTARRGGYIRALLAGG